MVSQSSHSKECLEEKIALLRRKMPQIQSVLIPYPPTYQYIIYTAQLTSQQWRPASHTKPQQMSDLVFYIYGHSRQFLGKIDCVPG